VCHAGTWIHQNHRYAWVAGTRRHHRCPVHWIKVGHSIAHVPIHPRDELGKLPINRAHGVFLISDKQGQPVERVDLDPGSKIKLLDTTPKQFRAVPFPPLSPAGDSSVEAYRLGDALPVGKSSGVREAGTRLTFDHKSQSFMVARQDMPGGRSALQLEALNNRIGNIQGRVGSFNDRGSFSAGGGRSSGGASSAGRASSSGFSGGSGRSSASSGGGASSGSSHH
jgi:hypothetical protein